MPNATAQAPALRGMDLDELAALYSASDTAAHAVLAECARRDRIEQLREAQERIRAEWHELAYSDYLAAEAECRGELVNPLGCAAGVRDGFALWSGPRERAERYATEELLDFWKVHPRITVTEYAARKAAEQRAARIEAREVTTDGRDTDRAEVGKHDAPSVRHESAGADAEPLPRTGPVRHAGHVRRAGGAGPRGGTAPAPARQVRYVRPVQRPGRPAMTVMTQATTVQRRPGGTVARKPQQVPGDQLLDVVRQWLGTYIRFPSAAAQDVVTLWAAHAHCRDESGKLVFRATPRLFLLSSEPGSGKSAVLELLNMLCPETYGLTLEPTGPGLVKSMKNRETVCIDESDLLFGRGGRKEQVRSILNGGYTRNGTYLTGHGRENVFGPVALAGLDVMEKETGEALKALLSRGFRIRMRKAGKDNRPAKVTRVTEDQAARLKVWLAAWAAQERDTLAEAQPVMPEELDTRAEQIAEPLVAVADAAGGEWPERARAACVELALAAGSAADDDEPAITDQLADFAASLGTGLEWQPEPQETPQDAPEWPFDAEPPADEDWTEEPDGDDEPPTIAEAPVPAQPYDAWIGVAATGKAEQLAVREYEDVAKMVCQARARLLGMVLKWEADGKGGWQAGTREVAFVVAPAKTREEQGR